MIQSPPTVFHVGKPNLPNKRLVLENFSQILENGRLTNNGPMVQELEGRIQDYLGVKHCICVCNATIGLELVQRALDLSGEVIIPSFTFIATANSLRWQRVDPVFCDIRLEDHLIDSEKLIGLITPRTSAILAVPIWGQAHNYEILESIAKKNGLKLIFDSAHAFGCKFRDQFLGGFGDAEVFSFHATKVFSTGEGGGITTNSDSLAKKLRLMRNFGFTNYDRTESIGTNAKMSEFSAGYGLAHFQELDGIINHNRIIHQAYLNEFADLQDISFLQYAPPTSSTNYQYCVACVSDEIRDPLVDYFHERKVLLRKYFHPGCHRLEPYRSDDKFRDLALSNTEKLAREIVVFPTGTQINENEIKAFASMFYEFSKSSIRR